VYFDTPDWVGAMMPLRRNTTLGRYEDCYEGRSGLNEGAEGTYLRSFSGNFGATLDFARHPRQSYRMTGQTPTQFQRKISFPEQVSFDRKELGIILALYGKMVAAGEWRDYGISALKEVAVFSVFRRTAENPLYRIEKRPKLRMRQGLYAVISMDGQVLKRGQDLKTVLQVLERKLIRLVE